MKTKNTLVTSSNNQVQALIDLFGIAAMSAAKAKGEKKTKAQRQLILAQGNDVAFKLVAHVIAIMDELTEQVGCLKLISGGTEIIIGETDGQSTIAQAKDTFPGLIDSNFVNYGTNVKGKPTKKTKVQIFEMNEPGTFPFDQIFGGFGENRDRLCLTQSQIIRFVKDHYNWLHTNGHETFFLFRENDEYFVAIVRLRESGHEVTVIRLSCDVAVWCGWHHHRIVVPQL